MLPVACYLLCVLLHGSTLPAHEVAAHARARLPTPLSLYWLVSSVLYFGGGALTSLQPTATWLQRLGKYSTLLLFALRGLQISACDPQPLEVSLPIATPPIATSPIATSPIATHTCRDAPPGHRAEIVPRSHTREPSLLQMLQLGSTIATLPFAMGFLFMHQQEVCYRTTTHSSLPIVPR